MFFSVEGVTQSIVQTSWGTATIVCNGVTVEITPTTMIATPSSNITVTDLADTTNFDAPGFSPLDKSNRSAFLGGSCIADGLRDTTTGDARAMTLDVEIAENVLVGSLTASPARNGQPLAVMGVEISPLHDNRLSAEDPMKGMWKNTGTSFTAKWVHATGATEHIHNLYGFGIDPTKINFAKGSTITADSIAAVGYLGSDGKFHAYDIETLAPGTVLDATSRATLSDAKAVDNFISLNDVIDARGGCRLPAGKTSQIVTVFGEVNSSGTIQTYGQANCIQIPLDAPYGRWRFTNAKLNFVGNLPPRRVGVTMAGTVLHDLIVPRRRVIPVVVP